MSALQRWITMKTSSDVPQLELIPALARLFKVAEQAVARRVFFEIHGYNMSILCIRRAAREAGASEWKTSWFVAPPEVRKARVEGFYVPLERSQRVVPEELLPEASGIQGAVSTALDGRLWDLAVLQAKAAAKVPLAQRHTNGKKLGYAYRRGDKIYVALPSGV